MPFDLTVLAGHMDRVFTDMPTVAVWNGQRVNGIRSTTDMTQTLEIGGTDEKIEFQYFLRGDALPLQAYHEGQIFIIEGQYMRVAKVRHSPDKVPAAAAAMATNGQLVTLDMAYARTRGALA